MWKSFFAYAAGHGGPVHVDAAAAATGLSGRRIRARAAREGWWRPHRDVVAPPGTAIRPETWALAAVARARGPLPDAPEPAALTRWSAAAAYGVRRGWPTAVEVAVSESRRLRAGRRFRPVRTRGAFETQLRHVGSLALPVVTPVRLVRDLAGLASLARLTTVTIDLVQGRHLRLEELAVLVDSGSHFCGRPAVAAVLARLEASGRVDARPELELRSRLLDDGVPLDRGQVRVDCLDGVPIHLDLGIETIRFGIEVVSMLAHAHREQLRLDVRRANELSRLPEGWRVLRATVEDLDEGWPAFLALVRETVTAQSRRHLGRDWP